MSWLLVAIIAQVVLGTSAVFDKLILRRQFFNPLVYTFWLGLLGLFSLFFLPFGFEIISLNIILIALLAGIVFVLGMLFLFYALNVSEASQVLPAIGGLSPVFTLIFGYFILNSWLGLGDFLGFSFLVLGGLFIFLTEHKDSRPLFIKLILLSALLLGLSNILSKLVFESSNFITGFFWIKIGGVLFVLFFLFFEKMRNQIFSKKENKIPHYFTYFANRAYAGLGSILIYYAISLSDHPALVDATNSLKYIVIFFIAWLLLKEKFRGKILFGKTVAVIFVILGILSLGLISYIRNTPADDGRNIAWGITYSAKFSRQLDLDWQKNYEAILNELRPKKVRLIAYWDVIEKEKGEYDFSELDWLIEKTEEKNIPFILAVGRKVPRWPECHDPQWVREFPNPNSQFPNQELLKYIEEVVEHYKNEPNLYAWQVENEPFLQFGECSTVDENFLRKEIELVYSLDSVHQIITTDGGEFGLWYKAARNGDIFGTTMYRNVYTNILGWLLGNTDYPFSPGFFRLKEKIVRLINKDYNKKFIVIELQGEPWSRITLKENSYEEQVRLFSPDYFSDTIKYAEETGFDEYYFWGVEWWYYMNEKHGDNRYWEIAKKTINN